MNKFSSFVHTSIKLFILGFIFVGIFAAASVFSGPVLMAQSPDRISDPDSTIIVHHPVRHDQSGKLGMIDREERNTESKIINRKGPRITVPEGAKKVEQTSQGHRSPAELVASFDGLGVGFKGPHGTSRQGNPSDNSLAVGPNHIVQTINTRLAIFTKKGEKYDKTGRALYGPVQTRNVFRGFGGACEQQNNGDAVVRYDQLADRWLIVMPIFSRIEEEIERPLPIPGEVYETPRAQLAQTGMAVELFNPALQKSERKPWPKRPEAREDGSYAMCYAVSTTSDPMGSYYRYEFVRQLFPDYPRPAVWPDGYYVPTSAGDDVIKKQACVVEREKMLRGEAASEQCVVIDGVNFLNNIDLLGRQLPPEGAPNIMMATGGTQLKGDYEDDGIYAWKYHVDWEDPSRTKVVGPEKIAVAPYHYLCDGQLTNCVPQPGTDQHLDSQGDKIMSRLVYRRIGDQQSIVGVHSVNTSLGGGGVRWYEFRLNEEQDINLFQQGTYAPDSSYRWMASPAIDGAGNIGIGYSFGGTPHYPGQRFAGRLAGDAKGKLTLHETVLVEGQGAQTNTLRWQDYTQTAVDPDDDCTIWYVGDYYKENATGYSTKIGAFRMPGCGE